MHSAPFFRLGALKAALSLLVLVLLALLFLALFAALTGLYVPLLILLEQRDLVTELHALTCIMTMAPTRA